jgi:hypothetical protein
MVFVGLTFGAADEIALASAQSGMWSPNLLLFLEKNRIQKNRKKFI